LSSEWINHLRSSFVPKKMSFDDDLCNTTSPETGGANPRAADVTE